CAKPPALGLRAPRQRGDSVQRDERLADTRLAVEHERRVGREVDRLLLLGIEHGERTAIRRRRVDRGRPGDGHLAGAGHDPIVTDECVERRPADEQPACAYAAGSGALAGLDLVALPGSVAKERLGQRCGPPVEDRRRGGKLRARSEQVAPGAALALDLEVAERGRRRGVETFDLVEGHGRSLPDPERRRRFSAAVKPQRRRHTLLHRGRPAGNSAARSAYYVRVQRWAVGGIILVIAHVAVAAP